MFRIEQKTGTVGFIVRHILTLTQKAFMNGGSNSKAMRGLVSVIYKEIFIKKSLKAFHIEH